MNGAPDRQSRLAALRQKSLVYFFCSRFFSMTGTYLQQAAIAWQVYEISGSALQLGLIGLARFLPSLGLSLLAGALADSYDRRKIVLTTQLTNLLFSLLLLISTLTGTINLPLIYGFVLAFTFVSSFEQPAREAMLPLLVSREIFPTAVTVNSALVQLSIAVGPAVAGLMIAASGVGSAYAIYVFLIIGSATALVFLKVPQKPGERRAVSLAAVKEGVKFVWKNQVLLGAMSLDMFSVIFAGAQALLPIYAEEILHVGPTGYGLLTSSQALGAFLTSVALTLLPPIKNSGRALLVGVACFGIATIVFGVSRSFSLSIAVYALSGVADQINVVMRRTIIQLASPDHLRGRVSSIGGIFVGASNHLGMLESGLVAAVTTPTFSVVSGGIGCLVVVATIAARMPELRRYRIDRHVF